MFCLCSYRLLRPIHLVPSCSTAQSLWPRVLWHSLLFILQRTPVMLDLMFNNNHTNFYCDKKPLCVPLPLHGHSEVQWRMPAEICPSLLFSTTWQAVRDSPGFVVMLFADPGHTQCPQHNFWHYFQGKQWMQISDTAGDVFMQWKVRGKWLSYFNKELHTNPILILCLFTTSQVIPGCDDIIPWM